MKNRIQPVLIALVFLCSGCDILSLGDECLDFGREFEGDWRIQGSVRISDCEANPNLVGEFNLSSDSLPVEEVGGKYVYVGEKEGFSLDQISTSLTDVSFQTAETTPTGSLRLFFDSVDGTCGVIEGDVTGTTPEGCAVRGTFQLMIDPALEFEPTEEGEEDAGTASPEEDSSGESPSEAEDDQEGDEGPFEEEDGAGEPTDDDASSSPEGDAA